MPCPSCVPCLSDPSPLIGYDATAIDAVEFIGVAWGPNFPTPLGWSFANPQFFAASTSTVSQVDADSKAYAASVAGAEAGWTPPNGIPVPVLTLDFSDGLLVGQLGVIDTPPLI